MQHGDYENFTLKNLDDISPACHISPGAYDFLIDMQRQRTKKLTSKKVTKTTLWHYMHYAR